MSGRVARCLSTRPNLSTRALCSARQSDRLATLLDTSSLLESHQRWIAFTEYAALVPVGIGQGSGADIVEPVDLFIGQLELDCAQIVPQLFLVARNRVQAVQ